MLRKQLINGTLEKTVPAATAAAASVCDDRDSPDAGAEKSPTRVSGHSNFDAGQKIRSHYKRSRKCSRICLQVFRHFRNFFEVFGLARTCWDLFGCVGIRSDASGCVRTPLDTFLQNLSKKFVRKFLDKIFL